jgi:hypothetical protein
MKLKKKDWRQLSQLIMGGAVIAVVLSAMGYMGTDIWLASTQWLLVIPFWPLCPHECLNIAFHNSYFSI